MNPKQLSSLVSWPPGQPILDLVSAYIAKADPRLGGPHLRDDFAHANEVLPPYDETPDWNSRFNAAYRSIAAAKSTSLTAALHRFIDGKADARRDAYLLCLGRVAFDEQVLLRELLPLNDQQTRPLLDFARWLVPNAAHEGPIRLAIVLLGEFGDAADLDSLLPFACIDSLYTPLIETVKKRPLDPKDALWKMARCGGNGKIKAVETLIESLARQPADRTDIRDWLLRHGVANRYMDEELGHACAVAGRLDIALAAERIDDELLQGACEIIRAMLSAECSPSFRGMDDYAAGVAVAGNVLRHIESHRGSLTALELLVQLHEWLDAPDIPPLPRDPRCIPLSPFCPDDQAADEQFGEFARKAERVQLRWDTRTLLGWTSATRQELSCRCAHLIASRRWSAIVRSAYESSDSRLRWRALRLSSYVGLDLWDEDFSRFRSAAVQPSALSWLMQTPDDDRAQHLLRHLEERMKSQTQDPTPNFAVRGVTAMGFDDVCELTVYYMREGAFSIELILRALGNWRPGLRKSAIRAIERIPAVRSDPGVRAAIQAALLIEGEDELRSALLRL